jgi:hypothetical protein
MHSMKIVTLCLGFVVGAFGAVGLTAQARPNFSGTWVGVAPQQEIRELTVTHDGSVLSFEGKPDVTKRTFVLDGSETEMTGPDGKPLRAKAAWEGSKLVMTIHFPEIKQDIRRQIWAIDARGQLVIETEILGGKPHAPTKEVFKRR